MAAAGLHLIPAAGGFFCAKHVRRRSCGELSSVPRGTRERREGKESSQEGKKA